MTRVTPPARHVARARRRGRPLRWSAALLVTVATACGGDAPADGTGGDGIYFDDERRVDLLGDSAPERVTVRATGSRADSLRVRLAIHGAEDSLLYVDSWDSSFYFRNEALEEMADTTVQRVVRGHLTALLRDGAFSPPPWPAGADAATGHMPDPDAVRHHIAEYSWRGSAGVPDTAPLPPLAQDEIRQFLVPEGDVAALVGELAQRPAFTYHAGGELTYTIAWSERERRFIRTQSCC